MRRVPAEDLESRIVLRKAREFIREHKDLRALSKLRDVRSVDRIEQDVDPGTVYSLVDVDGQEILNYKEGEDRRVEFIGYMGPEGLCTISRPEETWTPTVIEGGEYE